MWVGSDWKIGPLCEPVLMRSQKSTSDSPAPDVSYRSGQAEVVAVLVGEDADAGVLGLDDVVGDLDVRSGDGVARDRRGMGPDGVDALGATAAGLVLAGVHEHEVVDDAVRLEDVAVAVDVALVLDVVVRPGEVGLGGRERVDRVLAERRRRRPGCPDGRSSTG